jgi:HEAT repeat protein
MSESEAPPPPAAPGEPPPPPAERQTFPFLVLQFFIFPLGIVAVCVAVFVIFGLIASEGKGAREYLSEVRTGGTNRRWQAAFELSKVLHARKDPAVADPAFAEEVIRTFEDSAGDDPRVRRYLALAMGRLGDRRAVPVLVRELGEGEGGPAPDAETRIYAIWALGALGDAAALPALARMAASDDAGVRKAAVHALGALPGEEQTAALRRALDDGVEDVRWNAALALGRQGDDAAVPVLLQMLDRERLAAIQGLTADQQEEAVMQAVAAAARLPDPALRAALERLREGDPSLRVRDAARRALAAASPP